MSKENLLKLLLLLLAVIILAAWAGMIVIQERNTRLQLASEKLHARLILSLIKEAVTNNVLSGEIIEEQTLRQLDAAAFLLSRTRGTDPALLRELAATAGFIEISLLDEDNRILLSSLKREIFPYDLSLLEMAPGSRLNMALPVHPDSSRLAVYTVIRYPGFYFVGAVAEQKLKELSADISLGSMIEFVRNRLQLEYDPHEQSSHIRYVVVQDTLGIIAASSNISSLSSLRNDEFLQQVYSRQSDAARILEFESDPVLETVTPFRLQDYDFGIIRLGTDLNQWSRISHRKTLIIIMFSVIFLFCLLLELLFYRNFRRLQKSDRELHASRRLLEIGRLGGEVAHEIRNPLNSLAMIWQRLRQEMKPAAQAEFSHLLETSASEIERLNGIIERFLTYSRQLHPQIKKVSCHSILEDVARLFSQNFSQAGIEFRTEGETDLNFPMDGNLIRQVLINLVRNSLEALAGQPGRKEITIRAALQRHKLVISVKDNGPGIPAENVNRIWDLYFTTREEGNGMGLAISRKIIEAHRGQIEVDSEPGKGTIFTIILPESERG